MMLIWHERQRAKPFASHAILTSKLANMPYACRGIGHIILSTMQDYRTPVSPPALIELTKVVKLVDCRG